MSSVPPSTSQVSLPSQNGATEFIIRSRSVSLGAKMNRMPTPRSKPSMTTYIITLNATARPSNVGRSQVISHALVYSAGIRASAESMPGRTDRGDCAGSGICGPRTMILHA
jgi:hypothetical protein